MNCRIRFIVNLVVLHSLQKPKLLFITDVNRSSGTRTWVEEFVVGVDGSTEVTAVTGSGRDGEGVGHGFGWVVTGASVFV